MEDQKIKRYHSRKEGKNIDDADTLWKIIAQAKYVTLGMVTPEGEPYCIAISHGYDREKGCLYFHTGHVGKKIEALRHQPRVCAFIMVDDGYVSGRCHHEYYSVICYGKITKIEDEEEKRAALKTMFYCLEASQEEAELAIRGRKLDEISLERVNMLRLDIDGISGKMSSHLPYQREQA